MTMEAMEHLLWTCIDKYGGFRTLPLRPFGAEEYDNSGDILEDNCL